MNGEVFIVRRRLNAKIIVFDFDGTIAYLETDWALLRDNLRLLCLDTLGLNVAFHPLDNGLREIRQLNMTVFEKAMAIIAQHEIRGYRGRVNKDVLDFIGTGLAPGQKLAIFSGNSREAIRTVLTQLGIHPHYTIGREDIIDHPKPSGEGLLKILKHFDAEPIQSLFIGDSPLDLEAGSQAGIKTVLWKAIWT